MKTLYLGCDMGAAGDMLMAALYELLPDKIAFLEKMNRLLPNLSVIPEKSVKCGILGTHMAVRYHGEEETPELYGHDHGHDHGHGHGHDHAHSGIGDIARTVAAMDLPAEVKDHVWAVYDSIAKAESKVHGVPVSEVHFHEVGAADALADVAGVCLAMYMLAPQQVLASPVRLGSGMTKCAHGLVPVPAPATAELLEGIPAYGGEIRGELCTPTGAALLRHFVCFFGPMPVLTLEKTGYGMGFKDFEAANCVRALWGDTEDGADEVLELRCNIDDMSPEALGFAQEQLWQAGALDVYTASVGMKKNRPGVLLVVLCRLERREQLLEALFRHTSTLGVREYRCARSTLRRKMELAQTELGEVRFKVSEGWGVTRRKAEYEDLARIARETGLSLEEVREAVK